MSRIHYQETSLEELVVQSQCILVVSKVNPGLTKETVSIGKPYPPLVKFAVHYQVLEVLKEESQVDPGATIKVYLKEYDRELRNHRAYYLDRISKSTIHPIYTSKTQRNYDQLSECIIFITACKDEAFRLTVEHAWETIGMKNQIVELIKKGAPPMVTRSPSPPKGLARFTSNVLQKIKKKRIN